MRCCLEVPAKLFVKDEDLCCILENLLDNALEAEEKLSEEERGVSLKVRLTKGTIYIGVRNHYREESVTDDRCKIQSSKVEDKARRLLFVERIAEKYYGDVYVDHESGVYRVSVLLLQRDLSHYEP